MYADNGDSSGSTAAQTTVAPTPHVKKGHALKDSLSGKKLDRAQASIKNKNHYKLLIRSNDTFETISSFFHAQDKKIRVKKTGNSTYMVRFPLNTTSFTGELSGIENGIIPAQIGTYDVIQPEVFETLDSTGSTDYLTGENLSALWNLQDIGAPSFVQSLSTLSKTTVGILDTGIDSTHPDLADNYDASLSYNFITDGSGVLDDNGHGTEVAGIVGAEVNGQGVFGVDPNADLVGLKVLDRNGLGTTYDVLEAIAYAKEHHISVINMSFGMGGNPTSNPVCEAITDAKNAGTVTVVSAGNSNQDASNTIPAACPDVIAVGAITQNGTRASFSNYGNSVAVYAPGTSIYTTTLNNSYTTVNGTSFAAPLVTGLVAKELATGSGISYGQILSDITSSYHLATNSTLNSASNSTNNSSSGATTTSTGNVSSTGSTSFTGTTSTGILSGTGNTT